MRTTRSLLAIGILLAAAACAADAPDDGNGNGNGNGNGSGNGNGNGAPPAGIETSTVYVPYIQGVPVEMSIPTSGTLAVADPNLIGITMTTETEMEGTMTFTYTLYTLTPRAAGTTKMTIDYPAEGMLPAETIEYDVVVVSYAKADYDKGQVRYTQGTGGAASCASCHQTGTAPVHLGAYLAFATDEQLLTYIKTGMYPDGATAMSPHMMALAPDEEKGVIAYLRALNVPPALPEQPAQPGQ